jgi:REP element-mobilizing transposase RayT
MLNKNSYRKGVGPMTRQARIDAPGTIHHVIMRGIEKKKIGDDSHDKREFIDRMGQIALENEIKIYAWALMTNHPISCSKAGKNIRKN